MRPHLLRTCLCDLLGIEYPIIQAGMYYVARAELAAAVSNAGGLGVLGAAGMTGAEVQAEIRKVRSLTSKPFGVDIIVPAGVPEETPATASTPPHFQPPAFLDELRRELGLKQDAPPRPLVTAEMVKQQIEVILEERVPVLVSGLGDPAAVVPEAHARSIKVMALVGNTRTARRVAAGGVDAVIAQGHEGGGHTGRVSTMVLIPQVVDAVYPTPVIAAGGIADGRGLLAALMLGAVGVWVGTRFVATQESHAHPNWKKELVKAAAEDTVVTKVFTGKSNRVIRNRFVDLWEGSGAPTLPMPHQGLLVDDIVGRAREIGRTDIMRMGTGQVASLITQVKSAGEVVAEMIAQAQRILEEKARVADG